MSISMLISDRVTGAVEEVPISTTATFRRHWEPAAAEEGLPLVATFGYLPLMPAYVAQLRDELTRLRVWAERRRATDAYAPEMVERVDALARALATHSLDRYEISFG